MYSNDIDHVFLNMDLESGFNNSEVDPLLFI